MDSTIRYPTVQKATLDELQLQCDDHRQVEPYKDKKGRIHTPIGRIDLKWHKIGHLKEYTDTFYVVESGGPRVVIKKTRENGTDNAARPLGLGAQTPGMA